MNMNYFGPQAASPPYNPMIQQYMPNQFNVPQMQMQPQQGMFSNFASRMPNMPSMPSMPPSLKKSKKGILILIGIIVLLTIGGVCGYFIRKATSKDSFVDNANKFTNLTSPPPFVKPITKLQNAFTQLGAAFSKK